MNKKIRRTKKMKKIILKINLLSCFQDLKNIQQEA